MELGLAQQEPDKIEAAQLTAWLLKDLGWVLVIPFICLPAAAFAILFTLYILYQSLWTNRSSSIVLLVAELLWLLGNSAWMLSEMLWDLTPDHLPWSFAPLIPGGDEALYDRGSLLALVLFSLGLVVILVALVVLCIRQWCLSDAHQRAYYVFGLVSEESYSRSFITFWIAKDMFWTLEAYRAALAMGILALCVVLDSARRFRAKKSSRHLLCVPDDGGDAVDPWQHNLDDGRGSSKRDAPHLKNGVWRPFRSRSSYDWVCHGLSKDVLPFKGLRPRRVLLSSSSLSTCGDRH